MTYRQQLADVDRNLSYFKRGMRCFMQGQDRTETHINVLKKTKHNLERLIAAGYA
ncbi:hypothetical protein [Erythrobacter longus]|uniref:hypothetical protein n=1 Tax=Erythrobacter longus TaxID=1044 RepID=UPI000B205396|nr:hypothetical protein [Erythrobacter longus]